MDWIKNNGIHLEKNIRTNNISSILKESHYVGATQIDLERIMYFFPEIRNYFKSIIKNRDGLVGLDGWVNQWLEIWRPNTKEGFEIIKNGIGNLSSNIAWKKYRDVKNKELWQKLDQLISQHQVQWHWVKGHSGDAGNETADLLANKGIDSIL